MVNNTSIKSHRAMMKYYWAILSEIGYAYNINSDDLHYMFKVGFKVKSTSDMDYDEWYVYLENVIALTRVIFDMYFDSEGYKYDGVSRVWLFGSEKPDNRKSLRQK